MRPIVVLFLLLAGGCGLRPNLYVVLPGKDGHIGGITVTDDAASAPIELATPLAAAQIDRRGRVEPVRVTQNDVDKIFGAALGGLPPRPRHFIFHFQEGTEALTEESEQRLPELEAMIKARAQVQVEVIGHTDRRGAHAMNVELSHRRAEVVRQRLIGAGLSESAITATGRGELDPIVPTEDDVAEPRNRRVEVTVR